MKNPLVRIRKSLQTTFRKQGAKVVEETKVVSKPVTEAKKESKSAPDSKTESKPVISSVLKQSQAEFDAEMEASRKWLQQKRAQLGLKDDSAPKDEWDATTALPKKSADPSIKANGQVYYVNNGTYYIKYANGITWFLDMSGKLQWLVKNDSDPSKVEAGNPFGASLTFNPVQISEGEFVNIVESKWSSKDIQRNYRLYIPTRQPNAQMGAWDVYSKGSMDTNSAVRV